MDIERRCGAIGMMGTYDRLVIDSESRYAATIGRLDAGLHMLVTHGEVA